MNSFGLRPLTVESAIEDGIQPYQNLAGEKFVQFFQRIPLGKYLYSPFEINYDTTIGREFTANHFEIPLICVVVYLASIYFGQRYMAKRERFDLRMPLAYWNAALSLFSFMGAIRTVPDLLYRLGSDSFTSSICQHAGEAWGSGATGLWVQLFIFSKIPELVDTFFIVARKRPLIFLHWYHHMTVLMYCWHAYATEASQALYFVAMNYSVHAVMYGYFCLAALRMTPKWLPPVTITVAQISQMVVGVAIQVSASVKYLRGESCSVNGWNIFWGGLMYASYLYLFVDFAVGKYMKRAAKKAA